MQGGYVDCSKGVWRLQGSLAVSRGIGDSHLKQWVIAEPETTVIKIEPECEFLILASDGLWEKVRSFFNQTTQNLISSLIGSIQIYKPFPFDLSGQQPGGY